MNAMLTSSSRSRSGWRRYGFGLLAVPAILLGMISMHFLASESFSSDTHAVSVSAAAAAAASVAPVVPHVETLRFEGCTEMCGPVNDMLGMACVLALLVSAVLLVFHVFRFQFRTARAALLVNIARISALSLPAPPSLHVLSISRT